MYIITFSVDRNTVVANDTPSAIKVLDALRAVDPTELWVNGMPANLWQSAVRG
jgi:hypothetical protein